ncbi:MAG: WbqC family protein [Comamonas sp.]
MKLAIMQPYFFPYVGYYQLVNLVDKFIFLDDVNYKNGGWINRNKILTSVGEIFHYPN